MMKLVKRFLAGLNAAEGFIHLIIGTIGFWGIFATLTMDWRIWAAPVQNIVLGVFSIMTAYVIIKRSSPLLNRVFSFLNYAEGYIHLAVAFIGFWGLFATGIWDWRVVAPPVENFIFGIFSILTGYILGKGHHHHH